MRESSRERMNAGITFYKLRNLGQVAKFTALILTSAISSLFDMIQVDILSPIFMSTRRGRRLQL